MYKALVEPWPELCTCAGTTADRGLAVDRWLQFVGCWMLELLFDLEEAWPGVAVLSPGAFSREYHIGGAWPGDAVLSPGAPYD